MILGLALDASDIMLVCLVGLFMKALASSFTSLAAAANKVVEVERTKRRLLGSYFRVAFFGEVGGLDILSCRCWKSSVGNGAITRPLGVCSTVVM